MKIFFTPIFAFAFIAFNITSTYAREQELKPSSSYEIDRKGYSVSYDYRTRNPKYVHEILTEKSYCGDTKRDFFNFKEDQNIHQYFRGHLKDFYRSGFDRGHMAAASNHVSSVESMADTFYLSNVSPQVVELNRGMWAVLEAYTRKLTQRYERVDVYTGPLFLPEEDCSGKHWVKYQVIGENDIAVPTHFFKVLILQKGSDFDIEAYILPNSPKSRECKLSDCRTTIEKVQQTAGILFSPPHSPSRAIIH